MGRRKAAAEAAADQVTPPVIEQPVTESPPAEPGTEQPTPAPESPPVAEQAPVVEHPPAAPPTPAAPHKGPGRGWTERFLQPVKYRRFVLKDQRGDEQILFQVDLPAGQTKPPEDVVNAFRAHKYWKDGEPYGLAEDARTNDESYATGLTFGIHKKHPKAWVLPNNQFGREVADSLDQALGELAKKIEAGGPSPD